MPRTSARAAIVIATMTILLGPSMAVSAAAVTDHARSSVTLGTRRSAKPRRGSRKHTKARHSSAASSSSGVVKVTPSPSVQRTASTTPTSTTAVSANASSGVIGGDSKTYCAYTANSVSYLSYFDSLVGAHINCALVFNEAAPTWAGWVDPYFAGGDTNPDVDWSNWVKAAPGRTLIVTQNMFPASVDNDPNWRIEGAAGDFDSYATQLAENLVAGGLGNSIIRLGHEANGTWYPDNIGDTPVEYAEWVQFWRNEVLAMKAVPGAHFQFDWCVNAAYRDIPLADYYPGNDVVNIIGIDAYDAGVSGTGAARWNQVYNQPGGIADVLAFAKAHDKPFSIPEWGLEPTTDGGAGDDPDYVNGIASVVADNDVAFQSYFYNEEFAATLTSSPNSFSAYKAAFSDSSAVVTSRPATAPSGKRHRPERKRRAERKRRHAKVRLRH